MKSNKFTEDLRLSLKIVWVILSVTILGITFMALFLPETLLNLSPVCISKSRFGSECFMCGITRAFVEISKGNLYNAHAFNSLSIFVFTVFVLNTLTFVSFTISKIRITKPVSYFKN